MRRIIAIACVASTAWVPYAVGGEITIDQYSGCRFELPVKASGMYSRWEGACENGKATGHGVAHAAYLISVEGEFRDGKPVEAEGHFVRTNDDGSQTYLLVSYVHGKESVHHPFDRADADRIDMKPLIGNWEWRQEGKCNETHEYTAQSTEIVRSGKQSLQHFAALFPVAGTPGWAEIVRTSLSHNGEADCNGNRLDHVYVSSHTFVRFMDDGSLKVCTAARDDACFATAKQVPVPPAEERNLIVSRAGSITTSAPPRSALSPPGQPVADQTPAGITQHVDAVFDRNKGAIYALYGRALRDNPKLEGKVDFGIDISPDGTVARCTVIKSELQAPELEQKLCARIQLVRFGAFDKPVSTTKTLDFFPAY